MRSVRRGWASLAAQAKEALTKCEEELRPIKSEFLQVQGSAIFRPGMKEVLRAAQGRVETGEKGLWRGKESAVAKCKPSPQLVEKRDWDGARRRRSREVKFEPSEVIRLLLLLDSHSSTPHDRCSYPSHRTRRLA